MRLLLLQNLLYVPTFGGANKANRLLLEGLAKRGHECQVIALATGSRDSHSLSGFARELALRKIHVRMQSAEACIFRYNGVEVHAVLNFDHLHSYVLRQASVFKPDEIIVSSQDPGQLLLAAALECGIAPVIYFVHTLFDLPFGPHALFKSSATTRLIGQVKGIVTVSKFMKDYLSKWGGLGSSVLRFPVYGSAPFTRSASFERGFVTFVNPCAYKGISIFLKLVGMFHWVEFSALPTWGTTEKDHAKLKTFSNVTILEPSDDIETVLARTRVLLMPSLLPEGFGMIAVEAMLRGIPVIASDAGGLTEAKLGVDYILPVRPINCYKQEFDSRNSLVPIVPDQDITPWRDTLHLLLTERQQFEAVSEASWTSALDFVSKIDVADFEKFFRKIVQNSSPGGKQRNHGNRHDDVRTEIHKSMPHNLSEEKRTLLALRALRARKPDVQAGERE